MRTRRSLVILVGLVALLATSCSSDSSNPIFGNQDQTDDTSSPFGLSEEGGGESVTAGSESYRPLPMREGLGTFNNYQWHMEVTTVGPTAAERMEVRTDWSFNSDPQSNYSIITTTQTGPDFDEPETSTQEVYAVEGETCQFDGESWTYTGATDQQREVLDIAERLFDFTIVPENPTEVGQESIAGIPATHYSYSVAGFGSESGALVTANQIDYWVADDTQVLLKYSVLVESRSGPESDPEAEVYRVESLAELVSADVLVPIDLPAGCLAEKAASEAG